ncbi:tRNA wybutosine-synthesizing protein 2 [Diaporthe amygdali]|uniref:tRNA wybutosine-synthesizing protein 2 n=1 Tax=Phomopsis amygdali TaxID=1214568 RepID=UPI0022FECC39|nr:tRNA wybutosine-synthesizing protein 2 [Diaporthe amygdali]KAJ0125425.1 tRNA wybutosine-synthesizing protein 2 [Diaporthe amygdali]
MSRTKSKPLNPISTAVHEWFDAYSPGSPSLGESVDTLVAEAPKRWVTYEPMVLLPSGSFTSPTWKNVLSAVSSECRNDLWEIILRHVREKTREKVTHLAANDGIPLTVATQPGTQGSAHDSPEEQLHQQQQENVLRSPIGLRILHGDFGPSETPSRTVTSDDFARAFWARTKQNGIHQTWAPRWTMFSRGNVKEKARLLAFHDAPKSPSDETSQLAHRVQSRATLSKSWAVDLYAGIGYFVFSYARLGMRVLCWELNPWSVEGLRRGAGANGWPVKIIQGPDLARPTHELVSEEDRIVVFLENNEEAARRVHELRSRGLDLLVRHVNCGLLPRSDDSWEAARAILGRAEEGGWLHLHENVGVKDIERRRIEIQGLFDGLNESDGAARAAKVENVELVKTFAPDVWHCVFDVYNYKA